MLNITRRRGERVVLGDDVFISVLEVSGQTVRLGIDAPRSVRVYREEIWLEVKRENQAAAAMGTAYGLIATGDTFFAKHGPKAVFFARWIALVRFAAAWLAGINHMRFRDFFFWNALGGITWGITYGLVGYYAGSAAADAISTFGLYAFAALLEGCTVLDLAEGLKLRRVRVMGAHRIELSDFSDTMRDRLRAYGLFSEIISWKLRMFVPTNEEGLGVIAKVLERYPVEHIGKRASA